MAAQALFLGCGLALIGMLIALVGILGLQPALRSLRWQAAGGEVLDSGVGVRNGQFAALVRYRFTVSGQVYFGSRVSFRDGLVFSGGFSEPAEQVAARYPVGKSVQVYYDPADPGRAVLEPGAGALALAPVGVGGLLFVAGLMAGLFAFIR